MDKTTFENHLRKIENENDDFIDTIKVTNKLFYQLWINLQHDRTNENEIIYFFDETEIRILNNNLTGYEATFKIKGNKIKGEMK